MTIVLRPRQAKAIEDISNAFREGFCAVTLCAPTSFGKTATSVVMIQRAIAKGKTVWFLCHLKEILYATADKLKAEGIQFGWIAAGMPGNRKLPVQLVMVQTAARRYQSGMYTPPSLCLCDESHLAVSSMYQTLFEWMNAGPKFYKPGGTLLLGLTGSPTRLDGRGMEEISDVIVPTCSSQDLVNEGLLVPVRYAKPCKPDLSAVHVQGGEYVSQELAEIMSKPSVTGSAVDTYLQHGKGRPGLGFAVDIKRSEELTALFRSRGIRCMSISGEDSEDVRAYALKAISTGEIEFLWSVKLLICGWDCPPISYISDMAPTKSLTRYLQGIGRGLRIHPGKADLYYADHAGNIDTHGNPLMARSWTLKGTATPGESQERAMSIRSCPRCFANVPSVRPACKCGHVFEIKSREIEEREGELQEIMLAAQQEQERIAARMEQGRAKDRAELIQLEIRRGRTPANAARRADYILAGRARKKAREEQARTIVNEKERQWMIAELDRLAGRA